MIVKNRIDITKWMGTFVEKLAMLFHERVVFIGLQGSYGRGEATANSDIDVVVILDQLDAEDLRKYRTMLDTLADRNRICGFISGQMELRSWVPSDMFQFYYDTIPIKGSLDILCCAPGPDVAHQAIHAGVCNMYHICVHNMLHDRDMEILRTLFKSAAFIIQAIYFCNSGRYIRKHSELRTLVASTDREILEIGAELKKGNTVDFDSSSERLFNWVKKRFLEYR
jgi:predicted nucleotidyltransferase